MISRYTNNNLKKLWSDQEKYKNWLKVEILVLEAYAKINKNITTKDIINIKKKSCIDIDLINEIEHKVKHDFIAFLKAMTKKIGKEQKWIHYGLTSTDVIDTAQSYCLKKVNYVLLKDLKNLKNTLKKLAVKHKYDYQIGRTHGIHAEVTTFGYKMANWYEEINRQIFRFNNANKQIEVAKISGAVGNYAHIPLSIQDYVAKKLGLSSSLISTQNLQRDRHAHYLSVLALIASSLNKFAIEIRHLQRTEIKEVEEYFDSDQKGSSAMPHKKNPIGSENISGLSRVIRGYLITAYENIALWHERDISHSSAERIILSDATILLNYMLGRMNHILSNLVVNKQKMKDNILMSKGVIFSQKAMLMLIENKNYSRQEAYEIIQPLTKKAYETNQDFGKLLILSKLFSKKEIAYLYDLSSYKKNIDLVYKRLYLSK